MIYCLSYCLTIILLPVYTNFQKKCRSTKIKQYVTINNYESVNNLKVERIFYLKCCTSSSSQTTRVNSDPRLHSYHVTETYHKILKTAAIRNICNSWFITLLILFHEWDVLHSSLLFDLCLTGITTVTVMT